MNHPETFLIVMKYCQIFFVASQENMSNIQCIQFSAGNSLRYSHCRTEKHVLHMLLHKFWSCRWTFICTDIFLHFFQMAIAVFCLQLFHRTHQVFQRQVKTEEWLISKAFLKDDQFNFVICSFLYPNLKNHYLHVMSNSDEEACQGIWRLWATFHGIVADISIIYYILVNQR